jgi:hypothetical protein
MGRVRPECPDMTFTVLSGNAFTRGGREYLGLWEEERSRRRGEGNGLS